MRVAFPRAGRALISLTLSLFLPSCDSENLASPVHPFPLSALLGPNLLLDPGFDAGGADWQNSSAAGRSLDATEIHTGSYSELIQGSATVENVVFQDVAVTAGQTFSAGAWVKTDGLEDSGASVEVLWLDNLGLPEVIPPADLLGTDVVGNLTGVQDWSLLNGSFVAPAGAVVARLQLRVSLETDDAGSAWFDDGSLAVEIPPDVIPPVVAITSPVAGTVVAGVFTITADATDDGEVAGVEFLVDGNSAGSEVTTPPYSLEVDSRSLPNGSHTLAAVARDTAGNSATSDEVIIQVNNRPPQNVVVIMTDDQRFDLMPYLPLTSSLLTAETVRFTRGFVTTANCCPSRSSTLTGLYAHNHHVLDNELPNGGASLFNPSSTIATWLQQAGYRTALIGKYLNDYDKLNLALPPGWSDFEVFAGHSGAYYNYNLNINGVSVVYGKAPNDYSTTVFTPKATAFITSTPPEQPLFLLFTPYAPHDPSTPAPADVGKFASFPNWRPPSFNEADVSDKPAWVRALPKATAAKITSSDAHHRKELESLQSVDRAVAAIIAALQQTGRWESTLFIFFSDNGLSWGEHRHFQEKVCPYEECAKVPFWVRVPGLAARTDTNIVANIDLAPTIAAWAGVTPATPVNGRNLLPLLQDPNTQWRSDILIEHLSAATNSKKSSAIRTTRYMYAEYQNGDREFYDLVTDPYQLTNTVKNAANKTLVAQLKARLQVLKTE
jgi:arylsulfatase A-like enzyme